MTGPVFAAGNNEPIVPDRETGGRERMWHHSKNCPAAGSRVKLVY